MDVFQALVLLQKFLWHHKLEHKVLGVVSLAIKFHGADVELHLFESVRELVLTLLHIDSLSLFLRNNHVIFDEFGVLEHGNNFLVETEPGVDSEGDGELLSESRLELVELRLAENAFELGPIILIELLIADGVFPKLILLSARFLLEPQSFIDLPLNLLLLSLALLVSFFLEDFLESLASEVPPVLELALFPF